MPLNYNLEDEDELIPREELPLEDEAPVPFGPGNNPAIKPDMPNVPRDPDDPNEKLKNYFKRQDELAQQSLRGGRQDAEMYRRSNSQIGLGQLLNQSANQFGSLGGKAASSAPLDQFSQGLKQSNLQELQLAGNERKAAGDSEDRKLKMMEYMQRQGFQAANTKRQQSNSDRTYELEKNKQEWGRAHPKNEYSKNRDFEFKLSRDYAADPTTKSTAIIRQSVERARAVANYKDSEGKHLPGNDMSLVYALMKANDPPSTVREGEFQMGTNLGGVDDKILGYRNKVLDGTMNDDIRAGILSSIETLADAQEKSQQEIDNQYEQQAAQWKVDPELIIGKRRSKYVAKPATVENAAIPKVSAPAGTVTMKNSAGKIFHIPADKVQDAKNDPDEPLMEAK